MKSSILRVIFVTILVSTPSAARGVIIRPDRDHSQYVELGQRFPAVCRVKEVGASLELTRGNERRAREAYGSGTLIAPRWVLTAAHVVYPAATPEARFVVVLGAREFRAARIVVHPRYPEDPTKELAQPDLALIELVEPVDGVEPIPIYVGDEEKGEVATIVGFGLCGTFDAGHPEAWESLAQPILKRAGTNKVDEAFTSTRNGNEFESLLTRIDTSSSATDLEAGLATGDSGGPALIRIDQRYFVAGIASASPGGGSTGIHQSYGDQDQYVRVSEHAGWIEEVTGVSYGAPAQRAAKSLWLLWLLAVCGTGPFVWVCMRRCRRR